MRVLFMDDDLDRHESFKLQVAELPWEVTYVETGELAIAMLANAAKFDAAFLDHDLAPDQYKEHRTGVPDISFVLSGTDVARWISRHLEHAPRMAILHSYNWRGAVRMGQMLREISVICYRAEFHDDIVEQFLTRIQLHCCP